MRYDRGACGPGDREGRPKAPKGRSPQAPPCARRSRSISRAPGVVLSRPYVGQSYRGATRARRIAAAECRGTGRRAPETGSPEAGGLGNGSEATDL